MAGPVRFVLISGSVALCFQGLVKGSSQLVSWAIDKGSIQATLAMPDVTPDCGGVPAASPAAALDPATIRALSFQLGLSLGVETGLRNAGAPAAGSSMKTERAAQAARLGVSAPDVPQMIHAATVLHDFEVFLQKDPQCVATSLAAGYGPGTGAIYQFAAALGHAWVYRARAPLIGPVFTAQLRVYGGRAGVPPDLWTVFASDLSARPIDKVRQDVALAVNDMTRFAAQGASDSSR